MVELAFVTATVRPDGSTSVAVSIVGSSDRRFVGGHGRRAWSALLLLTRPFGCTVGDPGAGCHRAVLRSFTNKMSTWCACVLVRAVALFVRSVVRIVAVRVLCAISAVAVQALV